MDDSKKGVNSFFKDLTSYKHMLHNFNYKTLHNRPIILKNRGLNPSGPGHLYEFIRKMVFLTSSSVGIEHKSMLLASETDSLKWSITLLFLWMTMVRWKYLVLEASIWFWIYPSNVVLHVSKPHSSCFVLVVLGAECWVFVGGFGIGQWECEVVWYGLGPFQRS